MQPIELATMIAIVARPKTTPPDADQVSISRPEPVRQIRRVSLVRRTVGYWLTGLGGTLAGR